MFDSDSLEKNAFITSQFYFEDYTDSTANVTVRYLGDEYLFYKIDYFQKPKQCQMTTYTDLTPEEYLDALNAFNKCEIEKKEMSEEEPKPEVSLKIDRKSLVIQGQINSTRKGSFINNCTLQYEEYKF